MLPANASTYIPPRNAFLFSAFEKLEAVWMYGDLVNTCPSGSSTHINPPCPCTVRLRIIVASSIKNTSMPSASLRFGGLYAALNAKVTVSTSLPTILTLLLTNFHKVISGNFRYSAGIKISVPSSLAFDT